MAFQLKTIKQCMLHYGTMSDIWKTQQEADFPGNYQGTKLLDITT